MALKKILILILLSFLASVIQSIILYENSTSSVQNESYFQIRIKTFSYNIYFNKTEIQQNDTYREPANILVIKPGTGKVVLVCIFTVLVIIVIIFLHYKTITRLKNVDMKRPIYRTFPSILLQKKNATITLI